MGRLVSARGADLWNVPILCPFACIAYGSIFRTDAFNYLTAGLRSRAWYWELLTMFRKALVLAIVTIIDNASSQTMAYVTANYFFLMLTMAVKPYNGSALYNVLECFGTSTMVVVALLLTFLSDYPEEVTTVSILIALVALTSLVTMVAAAVYVFRGAHRQTMQDIEVARSPPRSPPRSPTRSPHVGARRTGREECKAAILRLCEEAITRGDVLPTKAGVDHWIDEMCASEIEQLCTRLKRDMCPDQPVEASQDHVVEVPPPQKDRPLPREAREVDLGTMEPY